MPMQSDYGILGVVAGWVTVGVLAAMPAPAAAQIACGDTITGKAKLTDDLNCAAGTSVTVDGGTLDMNGRQIDCGGLADVGVLLTGSGSKLLNGSIVDCVTAVLVEGAGKHKIEQVTTIASVNGLWGFLQTSGDGNKYVNCSAHGGDHGFYGGVGLKTAFVRCVATNTLNTGFEVSGTNLKLVENVARGSEGDGFYADGDGHKFVRNLAAGNQGRGFNIIGSGLKLVGNTAVGSEAGGIDVFGHDNSLSSNIASGNDDYGIAIGGNGNKLKKNVAIGNQQGGGFIVSGSDNQVSGCTATDNTIGFTVTNGSGNTMKSNIATANSTDGVAVQSAATGTTVAKTLSVGNGGDDLLDDNANCGTNSWVKNVFRSSEAGGVAGHSCIQ